MMIEIRTIITARMGWKMATKAAAGLCQVRLKPRFRGMDGACADTAAVTGLLMPCLTQRRLPLAYDV